MFLHDTENGNAWFEPRSGNTNDHKEEEIQPTFRLRRLEPFSPEGAEATTVEMPEVKVKMQAIFVSLVRIQD
jgi:hypothetical protein